MPFDGIAVRRLSRELGKRLCGGRIDKIYQPTRFELVLSVRTEEGTVKVLFSASAQNARVSITENTPENPPSPPMFCMLLRKNLSGGKILSVSQPSMERILDIAIEGRNEMGDRVVYHLISEMMGKYSNVVCVDPSGHIVDCIHHVDFKVSAVRTVLPGALYVYPQTEDKSNPLSVTKDEVLRILERAANGEKWCDVILHGFIGFSPLAAREVVFRAFEDSDLYVGEERDTERLSSAFCVFRDAVLAESEPIVLWEKNGKTADFAAFLPSQYKDAVQVFQKESMISALEEFYAKRDTEERMAVMSASLLKKVKNELARCRKKELLHTAKLKEAAGRDAERIKGELITANIYRIQKGDRELICENYYEEESPQVTVSLDERLSPSENAERYFNRYRKFQRAEAIVTKELELCRREAEYLESVLLLLEEAENPQSVREIYAELEKTGYIRASGTKKKKEVQLSAPFRTEYMGYEIFIGRNNLQNDRLTMKMSRANDLWLHAKNVAASHVIIKYQGEEFPEEVILRAAEIAAYHSKAKTSPKVEVDYTPVKNVKKPPGAKPGMVTYEHYKTAVVTPKSE